MIQYCKPSISLDDKDMAAIEQILRSGWVSIGKHVEEAEEYFCKRFGVSHAIACSNATQALTIALKSAGWRNKRVAVPSFTWPSTVYAIESNFGNSAVFCDIDRETFNIDLNSVPDDQYDAVIGVDVFGNECSIDTDKPLIYDAAHGFGLKGLGSRGLAEVVSFSFTKIVTGMEGGIILTNDEGLAEVSRELRRLSSRMLEINSVVLMKSIKNYEAHYQKRMEHLEIYRKNLSMEYTEQKIQTNGNYSVFAILLKETSVRNSIVKAFEKEGIEYKIYYQPLIEGLVNTDWVFSHILCLPSYPRLSNSNVEKICMVANKASTHILDGIDYLRNSNYLTKYIRNTI